MNKNKNQRLLNFPLPPAADSDTDADGGPEEIEASAQTQPGWKEEISKRVQNHLRKKELHENMQQLQRIDEAQSARAGRSPAEDEARQALRERLEAEHERLFERAEETLEQRQEDPDPTPSFADRALAKNPPPSPAQLAPRVVDLPDEGITDDEIGMTLEEVVACRKKREREEFPRDARKDDKPPAVDKTILLSRFLAGLVDFVIILGSSSVFLGSVNMFLQTPIYTPRMGLLWAGLILLFYYAYGFYFFVTSGQTVGMFLVGLEIRSGDATRLTPRLALVRVSAFLLLSVACLFLGLLWGVVDRRARCWHDILSDSRVVRAT